MPYATVADVAARAAFRGTYTISTIPTASQVIGYIQDSAAQLDQWLLAGGYAAPFDSAIASGLVATSGQILLRSWNTTGAALLVEQAAQNSDREATYRTMWQEICKAAMDKTIDVPLPMLSSKAFPRGLGAPGSSSPSQDREMTFDNTANITNPGRWDL